MLKESFVSPSFYVFGKKPSKEELKELLNCEVSIQRIVAISPSDSTDFGIELKTYGENNKVLLLELGLLSTVCESGVYFREGTTVMLSRVCNKECEDRFDDLDYIKESYVEEFVEAIITAALS